jgi:hypothetical protein
MPLMKITGRGLCSIAALTGILWGCVLAENLTVAHARIEGYRALEQIHQMQLKKSIIPTTSPATQPQPALPFEG